MNKFEDFILNLIIFIGIIMLVIFAIPLMIFYGIIISIEEIIEFIFFIIKSIKGGFQNVKRR